MKPHFNQVTIHTTPKPDMRAVKKFKDNLAIHIKSGYKTDGAIKKHEDGSFSQKLVKK